MKKTLTKIFSFNFIGSILNFFTTIFIVNLFGLDLFGKFAIISSSVGLITLVYIVLPPSYSVFKLQDIKEFKNILIFNYFFNSIFIILLIFTLTLIINFNVSSLYLITFSILTGVLNFFDVYLKAVNKLDKYFFILLIITVSKVLAIIIFYMLDFQKTLDDLMLINIFSLFVAILYGFISTNIKVKVEQQILFNYFKHIKDNFPIIKTYYLSIALKRLKDNATIIILSAIFSSEIIGLYTLFTKVSMFVLGQARVIEAYFMNRQNLQNISFIEDKKFILSIILQILIIFVGIVYLKISVGHYYLSEIIIYSFISYPYINLIFIRNKLMSEYKVYLLNYIYLFYVVSILLFYIISKFLVVNLFFLLLFILLIENLSVVILNKGVHIEQKR